MSERHTEIIYSNSILSPNDDEAIEKSLNFWKDVINGEPILTRDKDNRIIIILPNYEEPTNYRTS